MPASVPQHPVAPDEAKAIFSRNFIAVSLINLLVMMAYYLLFVISGPYAIERFNASPSIAGLAAGCMVLGSLAGRFVIGRVIEAIGLRAMLFTGIVVYIASIALYHTAFSLPLFIAIRLLSGVGTGVIGTVTGAVIALIVPPRQLGLGISYFSLSTILALAFGPFCGIFLMQRVSFTALFLLCLVFGLISLFAAFTVTMPASAKSRAQETAALGTEKSSAFDLSSYLDYRVVPISVIVLLTALCYANVQAFMPFLAKETGLNGPASLFFLVYAAVVLLTRPLTGKIFDKKGEHVVLYPTLAIMALGLLLLSCMNSALGLLLAGALIGAGFGNFQSTSQAVAMKLVPRHRFGHATSTFYIFLDFGIGFGPYLLGLLAPKFGYQGLFLCTAAITLLCLPLYFFLHGRKKARIEV